MSSARTEACAQEEVKPDEHAVENNMCHHACVYQPGMCILSAQIYVRERAARGPKGTTPQAHGARTDLGHWETKEPLRRAGILEEVIPGPRNNGVLRTRTVVRVFGKDDVLVRDVEQDCADSLRATWRWVDE